MEATATYVAAGSSTEVKHRTRSSDHLNTRNGQDYDISTHYAICGILSCQLSDSRSDSCIIIVLELVEVARTFLLQPGKQARTDHGTI